MNNPSCAISALASLLVCGASIAQTTVQYDVIDLGRIDHEPETVALFQSFGILFAINDLGEAVFYSLDHETSSGAVNHQVGFLWLPAAHYGRPIGATDLNALVGVSAESPDLGSFIASDINDDGLMSIAMRNETTGFQSGGVARNRQRRR